MGQRLFGFRAEPVKIHLAAHVEREHDAVEARAHLGAALGVARRVHQPRDLVHAPVPEDVLGVAVGGVHCDALPLRPHLPLRPPFPVGAGPVGGGVGVAHLVGAVREPAEVQILDADGGLVAHPLLVRRRGRVVEPDHRGVVVYFRAELQLAEDAAAAHHRTRAEVRPVGDVLGWLSHLDVPRHRQVGETPLVLFVVLRFEARVVEAHGAPILTRLQLDVISAVRPRVQHRTLAKAVDTQLARCAVVAGRAGGRRLPQALWIVIAFHVEPRRRMVLDRREHLWPFTTCCIRF
mmetsp:Transcript_26831/g.58469  ORF Transcript_26831/g.58469 Transcript_26831/m.58469 type:complete len:292 (+) Transcript_26831:549-1424(+)